MTEETLPEDFWYDHVSKSVSKDDIHPEVWERVCKMRNSPIKLVREVVIGEYHRPHTILPKDSKGYLMDYPEAFHLREGDLESILSQPESGFIPAAICGYGEVVFLSDDDYEFIPPFFDMAIADYVDMQMSGNR